MKKILISLILAVLSVACISSKVYADDYTVGDFEISLEGNSASDLKFTPDPKVDSSYFDKTKEILSAMQPGDTAKITYVLENKYSEPLDWYMSNEAIRPFEDEKNRESVDGGGYSYSLVYTDGFGTEKVLYDSTAVGGEGLEKDQKGLRGATNALDDMFLLDTLNPKEKSKLVLNFKLDGESQPNSYQEVVGELRINFGVELQDEEKPKPEPKEEEVVKEVKKTVKSKRTVYLPYTGDDSNLAYYAVVELLLLNALMATGIAYIFYKRKQEAR